MYIYYISHKYWAILFNDAVLPPTHPSGVPQARCARSENHLPKMQQQLAWRRASPTPRFADPRLQHHYFSRARTLRGAQLNKAAQDPDEIAEGFHTHEAHPGVRSGKWRRVTRGQAEQLHQA